MKPTIYEMSFNGGILARGFWLYIWEITTQEKINLYYVGRTGDSSSNKAQSPFTRMGQHLGSNHNNNMLRRYLEDRGTSADQCAFRLVAYGPILAEATTKDEHVASRDIIAALEKALANYMKEAGYDMLNTVKCQKAPAPYLWAKVRDAFAEHFPKL